MMNPGEVNMLPGIWARSWGAPLDGRAAPSSCWAAPGIAFLGVALFDTASRPPRAGAPGGTVREGREGLIPTVLASMLRGALGPCQSAANRPRRAPEHRRVRTELGLSAHQKPRAWWICLPNQRRKSRIVQE